MITESVVVNISEEPIEIECKHCGNKQEYQMRGNKIPKRPKTTCKNCDKWIYINRSLLVKNDDQIYDQKIDRIDQKTKETTYKPERSLKTQELILTKPKIDDQKTDQMTKSIDGPS